MKVPQCGEMFEERYRLDELLGEGGSAWVFRAYDTRAGRDVALKLFKPESDGYEPSTHRRFEREARIIANLRDPHTVTLFASGQSKTGYLYMVFEFVRGSDLAELLIERERLHPSEAISVLQQVLSSLREAHTQGLLHRDVKPENIRIAETDGDSLKVKLLDFGLARAHDPDDSITRAGEFLGTPRYMSPEALTEEPLTAASDVYSAGIVAMEMLFGRDALHGNDWVEQYDRLITGHVFVFEGMDEIPDALMDIIEGMTQRRAGQRYQSAAAVLRALDELEGDYDEPNDTVDETADRARPPISRPPRPKKTPSSNAPPLMLSKRSVAVASAVVAVITAAIVYALWPQPEDNAVVIPKAVLNTPSVSRAQAPPPAPADVGHSPAAAVDAQANVGASADGDAGVDLSSGCGRPAGVASNTEYQHAQGVTSYRWRVHVPSSYQRDRPHPVVILLHHDDSGSEEMIAATKITPLSDREQFVVIAVDSLSSRRAWEDPKESEVVKLALDDTVKNLCVDQSRVFLVGHGTGSGAALALSCEAWVTALAVTSYLPRNTEFICQPAVPRPAILITPGKTRHVPINGGVGCGGTGAPIASLKTFEKMWRDRNDCSERVENREDLSDGTCRSFDCETPLTSCVMPTGGFGWPGTKARGPLQDVHRCDGNPSDFPSMERIWKFFQDTPSLPSPD